MRVEVVWSPAAGDVRQAWLDVAEGCTVEQALRAWPEFTEALHQLDALKIGVWGRLRPLDTPLRERDRIEVYRPLTVDPKEARRLRYQARGERIVSRHRPLAGGSGKTGGN
ncbi:RnfH family protein [Pelomonas sp. KK5]|uniref:RnfH family protein n=1 Tax=Pelomonas sp. KK5 TaxID=1855730 RepID=UPI00097CAB4F|nr:RnfH family protein [Pelomonas sp. KK5]